MTRAPGREAGRGGRRPTAGGPGRRPTGGRPPRGRGLSRERIAAAALAIVDADGTNALSARRLAAALGCEAMSLYHHMEGKEDIFDAVVEGLLATLPGPNPPRPGSADWRAAARSAARAYLALAESHPRAFVLIATRRWRTPAALRLAESSVAMFQAAGFGPGASLRAVRTLGAYLNGAGLAAAAWRLDAAAGRRAPAAGPALPAGLAHLAAASNEKAVRADLDAGLEALLDAIAAMA